MTEDRNRNSILRQLAALKRMSLEEVTEKWRDLYGSEPPNYRSSFMKKCLAYRIQELFYGGLPESVQSRLEQLAAKDPLCLGGKQKMPDKQKHPGAVFSGTRFTREWNGNFYEVIARDNGFEYKGQVFRSLTAVATHITGVKRSGNLFFGRK